MIANLIGKRWLLPARILETLPIYNPATAEVIEQVPLSGSEEVDLAVQEAARAYTTWSQVPVMERVQLMFRFKALLEENLEELSAIITRHHGKTLEEARGEVRRGIEVVDFACGAPTLLQGRTLRQVGRDADQDYYRYPLGVVAGIPPFNFPVMIPLWMFPLAVVAGNTFVLKPGDISIIERQKLMSRKHLLSHLAHAEILTPKLEESVKFFKELMGLEETSRSGQSVYLRCWGEYYHHSIVLTEGSQPALGHIGWRTDGPEELEIAVQQIEASGRGEGWYEDSVGHGRAYRFRGPGGHLNEVFWEVERYVAPPELRSTYPARPQRFTGRGIAPRQIDHVTVASTMLMDDVAWYRDNLGFRFTEYTVPDEVPDLVVFAMITTNEKSHDLGFVADFSGVPGRVNHVAFFVPGREDLLRGAEVLLDAGMPIEYGPGAHGMGEQTYLYFREPGGMRIELNASGYRNYVPDWEPIRWVPSQGSNTQYRNTSMPDSMTESFPPAAGHSFPEPVAAGKPSLINPYSERGRG